MIHVQTVRCAKPAEVEIETAVVVDIDKGGALLPDGSVRPRVGDPGAVRDIGKFPSAQIPIQPAGVRLADHKQVRPAVLIVVADGDPRADRSDREFLVPLPPHGGILVAIPHHDPRFGRSHRGEKGGARRARARGERLRHDPARAGLGGEPTRRPRRQTQHCQNPRPEPTHPRRPEGSARRSVTKEGKKEGQHGAKREPRERTDSAASDAEGPARWRQIPGTRNPRAWATRVTRWGKLDPFPTFHSSAPPSRRPAPACDLPPASAFASG